MSIPQAWQFICLHPRILSLPSVLSSVFIDFTPTVSANKASMQQTFDPFAGVSKHFNLGPAMPLMEIFLAKECEVHRSRAKQRPTMGDLYSYMDLKTLKTAKKLIFLKKLDDGWPESVEEQGLLLLVWRRNFRNTKAFTHRHFYTDALLHTNTCTHKHLYTETLLHTNPFTQRHFYTQKLLHTDTSTQMHFYTQTLVHANIFTPKHSDTQTRLHTNTFTHRSFYTQTRLNRCNFTYNHFYTQTSLHRTTRTHKPVYTQRLLHTEGFTHKTSTQMHLYTQTLLHTNIFTQKRSYTQIPFPAKGLLQDK